MAHRCPHCNMPLTSDEANSPNCPVCGHDLQANQRLAGGASGTVPESFKTHPSDGFVFCPRCELATDSLKVCEVLNIIFLLFRVFWNTEKVVACPSCMRKTLWRRTLGAIPLANLCYPIVAFTHLIALVDISSPGHTDAAIAEAHRIRYRGSSLRPGKPRGKETVVLVIILVLCAVVWGGGYLYLKTRPERSFDGKTLSEWIATLEDPAPRQRIDAAEMLGRIGPDASTAIVPLKRVAGSDVDTTVRWAAYRALHEIDPHSVGGIAIPPFQGFKK